MTRLFYALPLAWLIETVRAVAWLALFPFALVVVWAVESAVLAVRGEEVSAAIITWCVLCMGAAYMVHRIALALLFDLELRIYERELRKAKYPAVRRMWERQIVKRCEEQLRREAGQK